MSSVASPPSANGGQAAILLDRGVEATHELARINRRRFLGTWLAIAVLALMTAVALWLAGQGAVNDAEQNRTLAKQAQADATAAQKTSDDTVAYLQGKQGLPGVPGANGQEGSPGLPGSQGETGTPGPKGDKGDSGPPGSAGQQGPAGSQGSAGPQGGAGTPGSAGTAGSKGQAGSNGETGAKGENGADGSAGPQGEQGPRGAQGDAGPQGPPGTAGTPGPACPENTTLAAVVVPGAVDTTIAACVVNVTVTGR